MDGSLCALSVSCCAPQLSLLEVTEPTVLEFVNGGTATNVDGTAGMEGLTRWKRRRAQEVITSLMKDNADKGHVIEAVMEVLRKLAGKNHGLAVGQQVCRRSSTLSLGFSLDTDPNPALISSVLV